MDAVLNWMKSNKVPPTRENYLHLIFMGDVPEDLDPELLAELEDIPFEEN